MNKKNRKKWEVRMSKSIGQKLSELKELMFFGNKKSIFLNVKTCETVLVKKIGVTFVDVENSKGKNLTLDTYDFLDDFEIICYM